MWNPTYQRTAAMTAINIGALLEHGWPQGVLQRANNLLWPARLKSCSLQ
jgi:hypothetical protein